MERGMVMMGNLTHSKNLKWKKKAKNWLELKNCGWLGSYLKNIQSDLPNETRGQS